MTELRFPGQAPSQVARHFLELLDEVYRIHGLFLEEITALRVRVAELEASQSPEHGTVPDVPGCAVYRVSREGKIQSWSAGASELYGYSLEEVLGQYPDMLRPETSRPVAAPAPSVQASPRLRKDGRAFAVYPHDTILLDKAGQACGRMHVEIPLGTKEIAATSSGGGRS